MAPKRAAGSEADTSERRPPAPKASGSHAKPSESFFLLPSNPYRLPRIQALISATYPLTTTLPGTLMNSKRQQLALQNVPQALGDGIPFGLKIRDLRPLYASLDKGQKEVTDKWQMPFNDLATRVLTAVLALSDTKLARLYRIRLKEGNKGQVPGLEGYSCWTDQALEDVDTVRGEDGVCSSPKDLTKIASSITIPVPTSIEALFVLFGKEAFIKSTLQASGRPKHDASTTLVQPAIYRFWVTFAKRYTGSRLAAPVLDNLKQQGKWLKDAVKLQEELEAYADVEENANEIEAKSRSLHALLNLLTPSFGFTQPHSETHPQLDDLRDILVKHSYSTAYLETLRMDADPLMQKAISKSQGGIAGGSLLDFSLMTEALNNISDLADTSLSLGLDFWRDSGISDLLEWADMQGGWAGLTIGSQASDPPREHDLAGALEMMARAFSGFQGAGGADYRRGVLVADEPGVNGTLQSILVILGFASLARRFARSTTATYTPIMLPTRTGTAIGSNIPRLIKDADWKGHRGFAETGKLVPRCLPSIIVAPSDAANYFEAAIRGYSDTLCVSRIKTEASASRIILRIQREIEVWKHATENELPTEKLNCPADQVVIITSSLLYKLSAAHGQPTARLRRSLFDLEFLVAVLAEAHCFRTPGDSLSAVNQLTTRAAFVIARTPTPILTTALDVCHIAYAANFVHAQTYLGSANPPPSHYAQLKKSISKRMLGVILGKEVLAQVWFESAARTSNSTSTHSESVLAARLQETLGLEGIEAGLYAKATSSALEVHTKYLMRRCRNDLDSRGHPILKLGTTTSTVLTVTLSKEETDNYRTYIEGRRLAGMSMSFTGVEAASTAPAYYAQKFDATVLSSCPTKMKAVLDLIELIRCREKLLPEEEKSKIVIWGGLEILPELKRHAKARSITLLSLTGYTLPDDRKTLVHQVNQHRQHPADGGDGTTDIVFCNGIIGESSDLSRCNVVIHLSLPANRATYERRNARSHFSPRDPSRRPLDISIYSIIALNSPDIVVFLTAVLKAGLAETLYGESGEGRAQVLGWIEGIVSDAERKEMKGSEGSQLGAGVALDSTQAEVFKDDDLESFWKFLEPAVPHPTDLGEKARNADDPREFRAREKEAIRLGKEDQLKPRQATVITEEDLQKRGSQSINSWINKTFLELEACRQQSESSANTKMTHWIRCLTPIFDGNTARSDLSQTQLGEIDDTLLEMKANDRIARYITGPGSTTPASETPKIPLELKLPRDNDGVWLWWNIHKAKLPVPAVVLDRSARIALGLPPATVKSSPKAIIDLTADSDDEEPI